MSGLLKNYIKLLVESVEDNEKKYADMIAAKNQEMQQPKFYGDELNRIIYELKNYKKHPGGRIINPSIEDVLDMNGYEEIGSGYYRTVWSRDDVDFVIKVQKSSKDYRKEDEFNDLDYDDSNQIEYNTYFDEKAVDGRYYNLSIYPKIYGYDDIAGKWIIFEKVNTFRDDIPFKKFFPLFYKQTADAYQIVKKGLNIDDYNDTFPRVSDLRLFFFFRSFLLSMRNIKFADAQTISNYIKFLTIQFFAEDCTPRNYTRQVFKDRVKPILNQSDMLFKITPDLAYIMNRLDYNIVSDLHTGNVGYRDIKDPSKPWESFVIIDYAL